MYSGSDSTESQKFPQWALNPSTYQNMANDQVDWAALAQQWIIMKEAGPPPVPGEQPVTLNKKNKREASPEMGEAPMDMEDKDENPPWPGPPKVASNEWGWNNQNQNWNNSWNNSWNGPPHSVPPPTVMMKPPLLPTPKNYNELSAPPESSSDNAVPFAGTARSNDYSPVYWTNNRVIKPRNKRFSKINVPTAVAPIAPIETPQAGSPPTLDAAKRKSLPAWIREGLEKMERDKLKQLEREKEKFEREVFHEKIKQTEKEKMEILKTTMQEQQKSKFESDGELTEEEEPQTDEKSFSYKPEPVLTQEELMLKVRRTMTEVLLKVTNAEIATIVKEESLRWIKKLKASDHRSSAPSGANITAKLGLGIYGEGSDSSSEDSEDEYLKEKRDSDSELKDIIRKKVSDFSRTEREIEEKLAEAEGKKGGYASRDSSPDSSQNESQVDARTQGQCSRFIFCASMDL
ncbi:unnamed protein product [Brassicogethes aeneus]|uniref:Arginine/serine-rich protein PNISR n=1 Tax=Brassicogethes aeneus TaxID=1431903 RepID=A0A9P0B342_BRAAE|nr:unnamed protein product [Brassicogethes aeneus]